MYRIVITSFVILISCGSNNIIPTNEDHICGPTVGIVKKVIDGDTIELESGEKIRYLLVDAPERSDNECFAEEAYDLNNFLVHNTEIRLEYDAEIVSECLGLFNRILAYVYLPDRDDEMLNRLLLYRGYAKLLVIPREKPYRFEEEFTQIENRSNELRSGLWGHCE